jgi:hypothetical protein
VQTANAWADYFFGLSGPVQFAVFAVHGLAVFGLAFGLLLVLHRRLHPIQQWTPVGPFYSAIAVVFALFLAFHAADIWTHKRDAERAFIQAGSAIKRFSELGGRLQQPVLGDLLRRYVVAVKEEEWARHRNQQASPRAETAFHKLQTLVGMMALEVPGPTASQAYALLNEIARTRAERLWIGRNHTEFTSWFSVLLLGLMTHLAIAAVHLDRPRAGGVALGLFAVTSTVAYWSLGIVDDPYRHLDALDPMTWLD